MDFSRNESIMFIRFYILFSLLNFMTLSVYAYPEMVRLGYVNCTTCHTSQNGGDFLTEYGEAVSDEILNSNLKTDSNNRFNLQKPEWLKLGGHSRFLQSFTENSKSSKARFLIMQVELDSLIKVNQNLVGSISVARFEPSFSEAEWKDFIYSPHMWIKYLFNPDQNENSLSLKVGRFFPSYGINTVEHTFVNRRYLEFNPGQERLTAELNYSNQYFQLSASALSKKYLFKKEFDETAYIFQFSQFIGHSSKIGFNYYQSKFIDNNLEVTKKYSGLFALIGWNKEFSTLLQVDQIEFENSQKSLLNFLKLGYEYKKGFQLFLTQEYYNPNIKITDPHTESYGLGFQYFPFEHFDFLLTVKHHKDTQVLNEYQNMLWLITHLYF